MNIVILTGNLCKEIELRYTNNGKAVVSNCIAVKRDYKEEDGNYLTDFINFVAWGKSAEYLATYAKKGDRIELSGRWQTREYMNDQNEKRIVNEVQVNSISVFSKQPREDQEPKLEPVDDGDLPF